MARAGRLASTQVSRFGTCGGLGGGELGNFSVPASSWHCLQEARGGDLLLDNIDMLPAHLYGELPALLAQSRAVRVIAITSQATPLPAVRDFLHVSIPALAQRRGDIFALAKFLLQHRLQQDISTLLLHTALNRRNFVRTSDLYMFLVNFCFVAARMGKNKLDRAIINEALSFSDKEQFENYLTFLVGSIVPVIISVAVNINLSLLITDSEAIQC